MAKKTRWVQFAGPRGFTLEQNSSFLTAIFASSLDGIALIDPDFVLQRANDALAQQIRKPLVEVIGRPAAEVIPGWTVDTASLYRQARESGRPLTGTALASDSPDQPERGSTTWDFSVTPVYGPDAAFAGYLLRREAREQARLTQVLAEVNEEIA
ncbi:MAG: PAS domain-containing protein, partial [Chloroflexota bacterium]